MRNLKHALAVAVMAVAYGAAAQSLPAGHPMNGRFESEEFLNFWRSEGWYFVAEEKGGLDCLPSSELQPLDGQAATSAEQLMRKAFDPAQHTVRVDQSRHTFYCFDGKGVLVFYSMDRVKTLFDRKSKSSNTVKPSAQ